MFFRYLGWEEMSHHQHDKYYRPQQDTREQNHSQCVGHDGVTFPGRQGQERNSILVTAKKIPHCRKNCC
jgi:hypothetical protein